MLTGFTNNVKSDGLAIGIRNAGRWGQGEANDGGGRDGGGRGGSGQGGSGGPVEDGLKQALLTA